MSDLMVDETKLRIMTTDLDQLLLDRVWRPTDDQEPVDLTRESGAAIIRVCDTLVDRQRALLHGSSHAQVLNRLEPRQANDFAKLSGNRRAVYATVNARVALANAVLDRAYVQSTLKSYVFGYRGSGSATTFRATDNLYELIVDGDPRLFTDGHVYVLQRRDFCEMPESVDEQFSLVPQAPLLTLKVPNKLGCYLLAACREGHANTILPYSSDQADAVSKYSDERERRSEFNTRDIAGERPQKPPP